MLPLNWAITQGESEDAWTWYFRSRRLHIPQLAQEAVAPLTSESPVFISDRGSGLLPSSKAAFPSFHQAYCCFHIRGNITEKWGRAAGGLFMELAGVESLA
jgi:hypothetical protein